MSFAKMDGGQIDYSPCRYGKARIDFRGPKKSLEGKYVTFIGGTETYGKFVPEPFAEQVEAVLNVECVNLGLVNAGIDAFLSEPAVLDVAQQSDVTVVQVMGAQNMSNRYYKVHPRRNDRFIGASEMMQVIFNEVDFSEFHFTRHMLGTLKARAPDRYGMVRDELKMAWSARMKLLLNTIGGRIVLLWMSEHSPDDMVETGNLTKDPLLVDRLMMEELRPFVDEIVEVVMEPQEEDHALDGMICTEMEQVAAKRMPGPVAHKTTADALAAVLQGIV